MAKKHNNEHEFASFITHDGKVTGTWMGTSDTVYISDEDVREATKGIKFFDFLHTHLKATLFSYYDIRAMFLSKKLDRMMIVWPDNRINYVSISGGYRLSETQVESTWSFLKRVYENEVKADFNVKGLLPIHNAIGTMKINKAMIETFKWDSNEKEW